MPKLLELILYFVNFAIAFYGLSSIQFTKFLNPRKVIQAHVLLLVLAVALSYLLTQFLLALRFTI